MEYNKRVKIWEKRVLEMGNAINGDDFSKCETLCKSVTDAFNECKKYHEFYSKEHTFGELDALIKENMDWLIANDKPFIREYVKMLNEDKAMLKQCAFYTTLCSYSSEGNPATLVSEAVSSVSESVNAKSVRESAEKVRNLMLSHEILFKKGITESKKRMFENCERLLSMKSAVSRLNEKHELMESVCAYVSENRKPKRAESDFRERLAKFAESYENSLTESEREAVDRIISEEGGANAEAYRNMVDECVRKIDSIVETCDEESARKLNEIRETILGKEYCEETIVDDIANIMKINGILEE